MSNKDSSTKIKLVKGGSFRANSGDILTPENITMLVSMISAAIGITTTVVKGIKIWVDERKSRNIKIRAKGVELEISGSMSQLEIQEKLKIFADLNKDLSQVEVLVSESENNGKITKH